MKLVLSPDHILLVAPGHLDPGAVVAALAPVISRHEVDATPERLGMFIAQWGHESNFVGVRENLNYSSARHIFDTFNNRRRRFQTVAQCVPLVNNPQALANAVYNGRMGNRPRSNDGWVYRGGGWPQLTGRDAYRAYGQRLGLDLEGNPNLILRADVSAAVAGLFWATKRLPGDPRSLNQMADAGDLISVTQAINGGQNGDDDRLARYRRVIGALREQAAALSTQESLVHPVQQVIVNGVAMSPQDVVIQGDTIRLASGTHRVVKQTQVGVKLYVQTG